MAFHGAPGKIVNKKFMLPASENTIIIAESTEQWGWREINGTEKYLGGSTAGN